jgi:hypothetical protein
MKSGILFMLGLIAILALGATGQNELAQLRAATAQFHRPESAQVAGYDLVPGLDHCFNNPGVGAMGYTTLMSFPTPRWLSAISIIRPIDFIGAVEYVVPAAAGMRRDAPTSRCYLGDISISMKRSVSTYSTSGFGRTIHQACSRIGIQMCPARSA